VGGAVMEDFFFWFELILRWIFAGQMVFWGLNGFFQWLAPPPSDARIVAFTQACIDAKFVMPTVKLMEVIAGALLLCNCFSAAALLMLAPLIFVISGLHLMFNPRPWSVLLPISLPYVILLFLSRDILVRLLF
jgi:hypothetical protein